MYQKGDLIIYGNQGVCRIENIGKLDIGSSSNEKEYYTLVPVFREGRTYTPTDTKVHMRPLITKEAVNQLIAMISTMQNSALENQTTQQLTSYYKDLIDEYSCGDLLQVIHNVRMKQEKMESQGKKLGQIDTRYRKEAEELLHEEFAVVLGIPKDEVIQYITDHMKLTV